MQNFIKRLLRADGFLAQVACSFSLTVVFELLVGVVTALFSGLQQFGLTVFLPQVGAPLFMAAIVHVLRMENLGWILIVAIAWRIAPVLLKFIQSAIIRLMNRIQPTKRRVGVRPTPVTFDRAALKERLRRQIQGDFSAGTSPA